ncbi:hypothetical protein C0389_07000 [bacterium]|nr:hypothetical protein [bacterium]
MSAVLEKYDQIEAGNDANYSKFYRLAKDHFQIKAKNDYDYINGVKESIRFFSLDLPAEIKEIFIPFSEAPVFWIYESSLLNQIEEFMKFNMVRGSYNELHKSIKENYSKWVTTKLKSEKDYYATLTINFIERDINKHNIFKLIIKAIILTYQNTFYNPKRALEILSSILELLNTIRLNDQTKTELKYILNLYIGFIYLKENEIENANHAFNYAIEVKPQGSTAKIYCALTEINLGKEDNALYLLKDVFNYDVHRLTLALKTNNAGMFSYFYRNAFIYNIFQEKDFIKAQNVLESFLNEKRIDGANRLNESREKFELLKAKKMDEYFDDEILTVISFFDKMVQNYSSSKNTLLITLTPEFQQKYESVVDSIVAKIRGKYYREVQEKVGNFDDLIKENTSAEKHLIDELENFKLKSREYLEESIKSLHESYDMEARTLEQKIDDLPNVDRFNPRVSMSNNMTYNIIIAFVVFFIGAVSGYSNKTVSAASEFNSMFSFVLISGAKWGAISFIVGVVISTVISGIILVERSDMRHKLLRRISYLKIEKERLIFEHKENSLHKEKIMCDSINNSISQHRRRIEELKTHKDEMQKKLMKEAEEKIKVIVDQLIALSPSI